MTDRHENSSGRINPRVLAQIREGKRARSAPGSRGKYTCAPGVNPLVRELFSRLRANDEPLGAYVARAGLLQQSLGDWRLGKSRPSLDLFEAAVNAAGGRVEIVWLAGPEGAEALAPNPPGQPLADKPPGSALTGLTPTAIPHKVNTSAPTGTGGSGGTP